MRRLPFAALALLVGLAGCTVAPEPEPPAPGLDPAIELVNLWRVTGAEGAGDEAYLRLDARELTVWTSCGIGTGSWGSVNGGFVGSVWGSSPGPECIPSTDGAAPASLAWLSAAASFRAVDDGFVLLDAEGDEVATLTIDGAPTSNPYLIDDYLIPPKITAEVRAAFVSPAPLPAHVEPAREIDGRWTSVEPSDFERFAEFGAGTWSASDGCNPTTGRFTLGADGAYAATYGVSSQVGCDNWDGPNWAANAARVGALDGNLLFYDADATLLGTMTPA